jgi:hypothetical protein
MFRSRKWAQVIALIALLVSFSHVPGAQAQLQVTSRTFPETGQTVKGRFLEYWESNGGLMQQGYPISPEMQERSEIDGKIYTVQYFERAVFESHPEVGKPFDVLLSLLGVLKYREKYPNGAPAQRPNTEAGSLFFQETGKRVGGSFLVHFNKFGGVPQQGLPISDEFQERSELDGKVRVVQYFERAVFEWNPDNTPPFNVLLAQLGTFAYKAKQAQGSQPPQPQPPLLEPALPASIGERGQFYPQASGRYLIWNEGFFTGPSVRQNPYEFDIRALDLATNQVISVTGAPGNQFSIALDGSLVAWRSENYGCQPGCPANGVYAKDLATGQAYEVALDSTGDTPSMMRNPVVAGRYVAGLVTSNNNRGRIVAKNVSTGITVVVYAKPEGTPDPPSAIIGLQGSGRYLVWSEVSYTAISPTDPYYPFTIYAYDLVTGNLTNQWQNATGGNYDAFWPAYSLDGDRLIIGDKAGNLTLKDLFKGTQTEIAYAGDVHGLDLYGNRLLINSSSTEISGLDLLNPQRGPVRLLEPASGASPSEMPQYRATLAGDWLVWGDSQARQPRLSKKKLDLTPAGIPQGGLLALPPPGKYRVQYTAAASDRFIIWWDCPVSGRTEDQPPCRLRGFDLGMNVEVANLPGFGPEVAAQVVLAGSLLVWRTVSPSGCAPCPEVGIYALDLASNVSYTVVAAGEIELKTVAAYGKTVVWIEKEGYSERIVGKDLETLQFLTPRQINTDSPYLNSLQITDGYIAWNEEDTINKQGQMSSIKVYDRRTGEVSTVFSYDWDAPTARSLRISLDLNRIAIKYGSALFVRDLQSGATIDLPGDSFITWMQLRQEALVYASIPADPGRYDVLRGVAVYGVDLKQPGIVFTLVPRHEFGNENYVGALSGVWLVYSNVNAQQPKLLSLKLPEALWR